MTAFTSTDRDSFATFRSTEALQIAVIQAAARMFNDAVVFPAFNMAPGIARLRCFVLAYVEYCAGGVVGAAGSSFFAAATHEADAVPGPVRDRIVAFHENRRGHARDIVRDCWERGEVRTELDAEQFLFDLDSIGLAANLAARMGVSAERARAEALKAARALLERATADD